LADAIAGTDLRPSTVASIAVAIWNSAEPNSKFSAPVRETMALTTKPTVTVAVVPLAEDLLGLARTEALARCEPELHAEQDCRNVEACVEDVVQPARPEREPRTYKQHRNYECGRRCQPARRNPISNSPVCKTDEGHRDGRRDVHDR
jgi:hypothetical protein